MPYDDGTPCLHPDSKELQAGPAGICHKGTCRLIYKPTPGEDQEMHPGALLRCPEKEHTGESILPRCYYYCNQNGTWYAGLYSSKAFKFVQDEATNKRIATWMVLSRRLY
ncbi:hypothetical protein MRX96_044011 [Rhipicephalus microplus]